LHSFASQRKFGSAFKKALPTSLFNAATLHNILPALSLAPADQR